MFLHFSLDSIHNPVFTFIVQSISLDSSSLCKHPMKSRLFKKCTVCHEQVKSDHLDRMYDGFARGGVGEGFLGRELHGRKLC